MISARRRARAAGRQPAEHSQQQPSPSLGHALVSRCQAAAKEFADNAVRAGEQLAAVAAGAAAAVADSRCQRQQQPQLLLASLTSSALNKQQQQQQQPRAVLPDRRRGRWQLNPVVGEVAEGGSGGVDDGKGLLAAADENERFLVSEVDVVGVDGELKQVAMAALSTRANFAYTRSEIMDDMHRVFDTGYFSLCKPVAEETRDGIKLTLEVAPNPELRGFTVTGANMLPQAVVEDAFRDLHGKTLNFNSMVAAVGKLNRWYEDKGVLGQVIDVDTTSNVAEVKVSEAVVNRVILRYVDKATNETRDEGKTKPHIILRNLTTKPGQVFSLHQGRRDIDAVYAMGLFEDVALRPQPAEGSSLEHPKVDLSVEITERKTGGLSAGGGISASGAALEGALPGVVGEVSYSQRNLFGLGQRLVASAKLGQTDSMFRVQHTDPWVRGDAHRTSRTTTIQNDKMSAVNIHGRAPDDVEVAAAGAGGSAGGAVPVGGSDAVFVSRKMATTEYGRPLLQNWQGSLGLSWQQAHCVDEHSRPLQSDLYGAPLTFSGKQHDTMALGTIRVAYTQPSGDSELVASMEQALPLQRDWLNFNRFALRAEKTLGLGPVRVWVRGKGGVIVGDLPPYEAFPIGGTNSVRGYSEGAVGSGRNFVVGSAELRVPLVAPVEATLFGDYGTDLDSGASVLGDPAGARGKPGTGYGYGAGVRIDTPIGPLRLEYAINDRRQTKFHLGIGYAG
ncbi:hypothetical protein D9Q98_005692 [Chlorella vulgaris]|uniref:Uncharacterized protein n=1 Tax=Chlorella vulgaris TaxID=3077 RepID=A0A9D4YW66_CHLVU|nr:hypothetical protein D9Q98_005692 [Chlorella vulgaris]